jgi:transcriptional regulator with XRE-family HTH domain
VKNRLKEYRAEKGLTQKQVAQEIGVRQPTYQRWETGKSSIPSSKLEMLEALFEKPSELILMQEPVNIAGFYNPDKSSEHSYYGEAAIHFKSTNDPILISISLTEFERIVEGMRVGNPYLSIQSLANQTVILRIDAIADLYLSSEAYDDYGPEHAVYDRSTTGFLIPDTRFWDVVELIADYDLDAAIEAYGRERVDEVRSMIMVTDEQYQKLVKDDRISPRDLEKEIQKNDARTTQLKKLATNMTYQLTNGHKRNVPLTEGSIEGFQIFADPELVEIVLDRTNHVVEIDVEGYHRTIFLNMKAVDYVTIPTHRYEKSAFESAKSLTESPVA